ncbi:unnamed protein product [Orchesella dallaii]|uniref:Uncharacterized protein n=1 Tax=Orchesella dallaii TaxID=48710 RepID=A0ABP1QGX5_9HEXA
MTMFPTFLVYYSVLTQSMGSTLNFFVQIPVLNSCTVVFVQPHVGYLLPPFTAKLIDDCIGCNFYYPNEPCCTQLLWSFWYGKKPNIDLLSNLKIFIGRFSSPCAAIISPRELSQKRIKRQKEGAINILKILGRSGSIYKRFETLIYETAMLVLIIQPIPTQAKPVRPIWIENVRLTIQSKVIYVDTITATCYIACQICSKTRISYVAVGRQPGLMYSMYSPKPMLATPLETWTFGIYSTGFMWKRLNTDLIGKPKISGEFCDHLKQTVGNYQKLLTSRSYGHPQAFNCLKNLIYDRYNCTLLYCQKYFQTFLFLTQTQITKSFKENVGNMKAILPIQFGLRQSGIKVMILYPPKYYKTAKFDITSLARPISTLGWVIIFVTCMVFAISLRLHGIRSAVFTSVSILLEQDSMSSKLRLKIWSMLTMWSFGCILIRNVYTSSMYTFLTAKSSPVFPESLKEILANTTMDVISTKEGFTNFLLRNGNLNHTLVNITLRHQYFFPRNCKAVGANHNFDKAHNQLVKNLSMFYKIGCERLHSNVFTHSQELETVDLNSNFETFAVVYMSTGLLASKFAIFAGRNVHKITEEINSTLEGLSTPYRHSYEESLTNFLAQLDAAGVINRLFDTYIKFRKVLELQRLNNQKEFKKSWNFYSLLFWQSNQHDFKLEDTGDGVVAFRVQDAALIFFVYLAVSAGSLILFVCEVATLLTKI